MMAIRNCSLLLLLFVQPAFSGDFSINLYAVSYHPRYRVFNEENLGWGIRYKLTDYAFLDSGRYLDSLNGYTTYAGLGLQTKIAGPLYAGVGLVYIHQTRAEIADITREEQDFFAPVPVMSIKTGRVMTNVGYIPENRSMQLFETYFLFWTVNVD